MDRAKLKDLLKRFRNQRILVIGDLILDKFVWGNVSRISPEAPVPLVHVQRESSFPGGAANVARNLQPFAAGVSVMGITGTGPFADELKGLLEERKIETTGLIRDANYQTIVKTRVVARNHHVVRFDYEVPKPLQGESLQRALEELRSQLTDVDAVIIEDYAKGFVIQELVDMISETCGERNIPIMVDPNPNNLLDWKGIHTIKPNRSEAFKLAGLIESAPDLHPAEDPQLKILGQRLREQWDAEHLLVTLGDQGMLLFESGKSPYHTPTRAREVFDVSGAGDTVIAFYTLAIAAGASCQEAAEIANHASGVVVRKVGTATLSPEELLEAVE